MAIFVSIKNMDSKNFKEKIFFNILLLFIWQNSNKKNLSCDHLP